MEIEEKENTFEIIMNKLIKKDNKNYLCAIASNKTRDFAILFIHQFSYLYAYQFDLTFFQNINFFKNFTEQGLGKCIDILISLFNNKECLLLEEEDCKIIKLSFEIELKVGQTDIKLRKEKFEFILAYDDVDLKIKNELIWLTSLSLLREREENNNELDKADWKISDLEDKNKQLKVQIMNGYNNNFNNIIYNDLHKSQIINETNLNKFGFIKEKLKTIYKKSNISFKMIYDAKKNGDKSLTFHLLCDHHKKTLALVYTQTDRIFGGFANKKWNSLELGRKIDEKSFLFSIDKQKIYNPKKEKYHLYCSENEGPCFYAFSIENNFLKEGGFCDTIDKCNYDSFVEDYELNDGKPKFKIEHLEIYQILFHF